MRDAPGILGVKSETLDILRKPAVSGGSKGAVDATARRRFWITHRTGRSVIKRQGSRDAAAIGAGRVDVAIRVRRIGGELLRRRRERPAEHRLVNEVDPELEPMVAHYMAQVIAELILVLIPPVGEKGNRSGKLIVAKGLEARDGQ